MRERGMNEKHGNEKMCKYKGKVKKEKMNEKV